MQNNFECIFKLIVALTFLMCVVCSHYQYSFCMFLHYITIFVLCFFFVFLFFFVCFIFLNKRQKKGSKKKETKQIKKVKLRIKFSMVQLFFPPD